MATPHRARPHSRKNCSGCSDAGLPTSVKTTSGAWSSREPDVPGGDNIELIANTARHCLRIGYHVILEGILISDHYGSMLRQLVNSHPVRSNVFYLDVPLEETLRRHEERPLRAAVEPDKLRDWYVPSDLLGIPGEVVVDGTADLEETLRLVRARIGPVPLRDDQDLARFL